MPGDCGWPPVRRRRLNCKNRAQDSKPDLLWPTQGGTIFGLLGLLSDDPKAWPLPFTPKSVGIAHQHWACTVDALKQTVNAKIIRFILAPDRSVSSRQSHAAGRNRVDDVFLHPLGMI
jgi:hypothetical protein